MNYTIWNPRHDIEKNRIETLEKSGKYKFVCFSSVALTRGGWTYESHPILFTDNKYFALIGSRCVSNIPSLIEAGVMGMISGDKFIYSASRHDYVESGSVIVDGGRDYFRASVGIRAKLLFLPSGPTIELI